ncbi:DinB family protein [Tropicimonas marinistellae]|uniref:DinB family protein n=1 Tax=Tropicimonas marinistellae TaxID=1739787 RepID=UPI0008347923|nr:DinB family protein [Tropicimonas marinistellae]
MSRYNAWQNKALMVATEVMDEVALTENRGAFFGSIFATLNHILWADRVWMARIDGWTRPAGGIADSPQLYPTLAAWKADRMRADAKLVLWARRLRPSALRGDLTWKSGATGREQCKPMATCVAHMFNHQTHHRGQVHAMLTAAGVTPAATDLVFMPDTI